MFSFSFKALAVTPIRICLINKRNFAQNANHDSATWKSLMAISSVEKAFNGNSSVDALHTLQLFNCASNIFISSIFPSPFMVTNKTITQQPQRAKTMTSTKIYRSLCSYWHTKYKKTTRWKQMAMKLGSDGSLRAELSRKCFSDFKSFVGDNKLIAFRLQPPDSLFPLA